MAGWRQAVLHVLILLHAGHEVLTGSESLVLLAHGLGAKEGRLDQKLRKVRPLNVAVVGDNSSAEQILRSNRERVLIVGGAFDVGKVIQLACGLSRERVVGVITEGYIAEQRGPVL